MFTKRHYRALAGIIYHNLVVTKQVSKHNDKIVVDLANFLEVDNPRFDRDKFFAACYGKQ